MLPNIDSLVLFVRAAEMSSLTKAADASHIGLAAASRRIALLEHRFKAVLLERTSRGVRLTPAGHSLLRHARQLLRGLNEMQADMRNHAEGRTSTLHLLANTSAMTEALPQDLAAFSRAFPDIRLIVDERWSDEIVRSLHAGDADVGLVVDGADFSGLESRPYTTDRVAALFKPSHRQSGRPAVAFADLLDDDLITLEAGTSLVRLLTAEAEQQGRALRTRMQVRSFEAVCRMVQADLGVGLLPLESARALGRAFGLIARPLLDPWAERRMLVCCSKERAAYPGVERLVGHLVDRGASASPGTDARVA